MESRSDSGTTAEPTLAAGWVVTAAAAELCARRGPARTAEAFS